MSICNLADVAACKQNKEKRGAMCPNKLDYGRRCIYAEVKGIEVMILGQPTAAILLDIEDK